MARKPKKATAAEKKPEKVKEHKLDIFKTLSRMDSREKNIYDSLTDVEKKQFSPLVIMRWLSMANNSPDIAEYYIGMVNDIVNKNFWVLSKHPKLLCELLSVCGVGKKVNHSWLKAENKKQSSCVVLAERLCGEDLKPDEAELFLKQLENVDIIDFLESRGFQNDEIEEILKTYKNL